MDRQKLLTEIRTPLQKVFEHRLQGIVLYGSEARGDATPDSDVDVLVLLDHVRGFGRELRICIEALYPLALKLERRISAKPVDVKEYHSVDCPLFRNAHREGVTA